MFIAGSGVGGIGCAIPLLVLVAIFGGRQLDTWLGTTPFILVTMLLGSIIAGIFMMLTSAYSAARAAERQYKAKHQPFRGGPDESHDVNGEDYR